MGDHDTVGPTDPGEACSTTESFADHGIEDGTALLEGTHRRLSAPGVPAFDGSVAAYDRLESAFLWAYLATTGQTAVPADVLAALDDARAATAAALADTADPDLRTEVVPTFYRQAAGFHCAYRTAGD